MYRKNNGFATGNFWILAGIVIATIIFAWSMSWSLDDIEARADAYAKYEQALEADHSDMACEIAHEQLMKELKDIDAR